MTRATLHHEISDIPWRTLWLIRALAVFIASWGLLCTAGVVGWLLTLRADRAHLVETYFMMLVPMLIFAASYLLWKRSQWVIAALGVLFALQFAIAVIPNWRKLQMARSYVDGFFSALPFPFIAFVGSIFFCLMFALFLRKWDYLR